MNIKNIIFFEQVKLIYNIESKKLKSNTRLKKIEISIDMKQEKKST
jgi:hypothetical protein